MHSIHSASRRVGKRWRVPDASPRRQLLAVTINLAAAVLAAAALVLFAPPSSWSAPFVPVALVGVAAVAYFAEARLKTGSLSFFGATLIAALIALAVGGPLPALAVWVVPDVIARWILRREPRLSPGFVATVTSYSLAVVAGAAVLELAGSPTGAAIAPALYSAGVAMWALNFAFGRLAVAPFYLGYRPAALIRDEFIDLAPAVLAMLLAGVATTILVPALGVGALALLVAVILAPQLALERLATASSTTRLDRAQAARLYAEAISDVLGLGPVERREIVCAIDLVDKSGRRTREWREVDPAGVAIVTLHASERWAGDGWPAGLPAEAIPRQSRVLAVAWEWAGLTAAGTNELSHAEAMLALGACAGTAFDPAIVEAAARVVADEEGFAREASFEPTLHRLPLPRSLRRSALPTLLSRLLGAAA